MHADLGAVFTGAAVAGFALTWATGHSGALKFTLAMGLATIVASSIEDTSKVKSAPCVNPPVSAPVALSAASAPVLSVSR